MRIFALFLWGTMLALVRPAAAQMFSADGGTGQRQADIPMLQTNAAQSPSAVDQDDAAQKGETETQTATDNPLAQISQAMAQQSGAADAAPETTTEPEQEDIFIPEGELYRLDTPTADGSVRGGQAFVEVDEQGRMKKVDNIFLYYDQFQIGGRLGETTICDVRFNILSNLDRKINQLDIKLVWPGLTTTLSFSDVQPNTQTYYNYSLMGEGCYNMDKAPNIIVNRCRVRGMTASECAGKLVWLSR